MDVNKTIADRHVKYGDYAVQTLTAQGIKEAMRQAPNWKFLGADQKESLELIATKISRILHGDPLNYDSWHDISGYAELITERLNGTREVGTCYTKQEQNQQRDAFRTTERNPNGKAALPTRYAHASGKETSGLGGTLAGGCEALRRHYQADSEIRGTRGPDGFPYEETCSESTG